MFVLTQLTITALQEQDLADTVLEALGEVLISPIIAGGAPRDWLLQGRCKDIDIFVDSSTNPELVLETIKDLGYSSIRYVKSSDLTEDYRSPDITSVLFFTFQRLPFQIIFCTGSPEQCVNNFPLSLSKIIYKDNMIIPFINDYFKLLSEATVSLSSDIKESYLERIKQKYPKLKYQDLNSHNNRRRGLSFSW